MDSPPSLQSRDADAGDCDRPRPCLSCERVNCRARDGELARTGVVEGHVVPELVDALPLELRAQEERGRA